MKARLVEIAGVGFLVAFAASSALAQATLQRDPNQLGNPAIDLGKPGIGGFTPFAGPWTTDNVPAEKPFGTIDVSRAGSTTAQVRTWAQTRTPMERNELSGRCGVIEDSANNSRYPASAQEFCHTYLIVNQIGPPPALKY